MSSLYETLIAETQASQPAFRSASTSPRATEDDEDRPRRKQVKQACGNCQKASRGCDDTRPCRRCTHRGLGESCADIPRKPRVTVSRIRKSFRAVAHVVRFSIAPRPEGPDSPILHNGSPREVLSISPHLSPVHGGRDDPGSIAGWMGYGGASASLPLLPISPSSPLPSCPPPMEPTIRPRASPRSLRRTASDEALLARLSPVDPNRSPLPSSYSPTHQHPHPHPHPHSHRLQHPQTSPITTPEHTSFAAAAGIRSITAPSPHLSHPKRHLHHQLSASASPSASTFSLSRQDPPLPSPLALLSPDPSSHRRWSGGSRYPF